MELQIRDATPEDAEAAAPLVFSSGPDAFNFVFSHRTKMNALEFLEKAFVREGGEFGYRNHIVGTLDGKVVASGAGFTGTEMPAFMLSDTRTIFGFYGFSQGLRVIGRVLQIEHIVPPPKSNIQYIGHIGVDPEFRSRGLGAQLVNHLIDVGREQGRTAAVLDVSCENPRAEALYARLGFTVTWEKESHYRNETSHVPSHRRMEIRY
ncbi:MAG: N-acetyltransferase [Candidatus Hydrogenedentota bacterium]